MSSKNNIVKKENIKVVLIGISAAVMIFLLIGIPTAIIPTRFYIRMIPATNLDVFFLITTSLMLGIYTGLFFYLKYHKKNQKNAVAYAGAGGSFLAISCPICIKLLVLIFGAAALMAYLEPLSPYLGFLSIGLIGFGLHKELELVKTLKRCKNCI